MARFKAKLNVRFWQKADDLTAHAFVRFRTARLKAWSSESSIYKASYAPTKGSPSPSSFSSFLPFLLFSWLSGNFPWQRIRTRAALDDVRLHDLRHSFASVLVNEGQPLYRVQRLLGHANAKATQRYAHLAPETLADAAEIMGQVVSPILDHYPSSWKWIGLRRFLKNPYSSPIFLKFNANKAASPE